MSRSVYGSIGKLPIYGMSKKKYSECECVPYVSPLIALTTLKSVLENIRLAIERFYNPFFGVAPIVANMSMKAYVSTPVFMRFLWIKENPNIKFDKTNPIHLDDLKFIYNLNNKDWRNDPLFQNL